MGYCTCNLYTIPILIVFLFIISACGKTDQMLIDQKESTIDDNTEDNNNIKNIEVYEGMLNFRNRDHFDKTIKHIFDNQREIANLGQLLPSFISAKTAFQNFVTQLEETNGLEKMDRFKSNAFAILIEVDGERYLEEVVHCPLLAEIVNDKGLVK